MSAIKHASPSWLTQSKFEIAADTQDSRLKMARKTDEKDVSINAALSPTFSVEEGTYKEKWNKDEYALAKLGYQQGR